MFRLNLMHRHAERNRLISVHVFECSQLGHTTEES